jgi:subtilisin family serine protease
MNNFPRQLTHASGAPMLLDPTRLLLVFKQPIERNNLLRMLSEIDLLLEDGAAELEQPVPGEVVNHSATRAFVQSRRPITQQRFEYIQTTALIFGLSFIAPVYRLAGESGRRALVVPLPNVLVVRLREQVGKQTQQPPVLAGTQLAQVGQDLQGVQTIYGLPQVDFSPFLAAATFPAGAAPRIQEVPEKSRYLNGFRYFVIQNPEQVNAYQLRAILQGDVTRQIVDVQFETLPLIKPTAAVPTDALFSQQWDMVRIGAAGPGTTGWDISIGNATVVVAILDEGVDLSHPDLKFASNGVNLGNLSLTGAPTGSHGTAVAGIVGALFNNMLGIAGVAGGSLILPLAFDTWSDVEVAIGINYARLHGADVINMSFGFNGWSTAIINPAIEAAFAANIVLVAATHNHNGAITYPATHPLVIAVGASDEVDNRKSPTSPDMEGWGSNFGAQISVVAPGVHIPTTDRLGSAGYNTSAGSAGDFTLTFNGTSAATPHVAGLAALIRAIYPTLTNVQIRTLIERSAEKVGTVAYNPVTGYTSGTWNQEMGYGRINVFRALDAADVIIKDAPADTGVEPFAGGNFWAFSDIVVRITDDGVFVPGDPLQSKNVERGQPNYVYIRVTNNGPREARNVAVTARITPFIGLQFVYPHDFTVVDAAHVSPAPLQATFASIPAGTSVLARFRIEAAQTETLYGWVAGQNWHPCLLATVVADNDYAFATTALSGATAVTPRVNNLAQRNLSVIDVLAGATATLPFIAGNRLNAERSMTLVIDRSRLPQKAPLLLSLDDDGSAFPLIDFVPPQRDPNEVEEEGCGASSLVFLEPTRIQTRLGCSSGIMTLARGSRFDCAAVTVPGGVEVIGGDVIVRGNRRYVSIEASQVIVRIQKAPNQIYAMSLRTTISAGAETGEQYLIQIAQQNAQGTVVGGAAVVYVVA